VVALRATASFPMSLLIARLRDLDADAAVAQVAEDRSRGICLVAMDELHPAVPAGSRRFQTATTPLMTTSRQTLT